MKQSQSQFPMLLLTAMTVLAGGAARAQTPPQAQPTSPAPAQPSAPADSTSPPAPQPAPSAAPTVPPTGAATGVATDTFVPFLGEVTRNDVYIRSGASFNHYPVTKQSAGSSVTVVGEVGPWYQILPPEGVFSIISAEFVDIDAADKARGVVNGDNVRVRAASSLPEYASQRSHVQTMVSRGAELRVIGESADGYLRIVPPKGVAVWISRDFVARKGDAPAGLDLSAIRAAGGTAQPSTPSGDEPSITDATAGAPVELETIPTGVITRSPTAPPSGGTAPADSGYVEFKGGQRIPGSPARRELVRLDALADAEFTKPVADRDFSALIPSYRSISQQGDDEFAQAYAAARVTQLESLSKLVESVRAAKQLELDADAERQRRLENRGLLTPRRPMLPGGFDVRGEVRVSALFPEGTLPARYRLVDTVDGKIRTIGYIEIPTNVSIDVSPFLGKVVGVRASEVRVNPGDVDQIATYVVRELVLNPDSADSDEAPAATESGAGSASPNP